MKGLIIREPWIGLILSGAKTWEMRSRRTSIRGRIALIRGGSGLVCGVADLVQCLPALTPPQMKANVARHSIPDERLSEAIASGWTTPWVLRNVERLEPPVPYKHPSGAVTWVDLSDQVAACIRAQAQVDEAPRASAPAMNGHSRPTPDPVVSQGGEWIDIRLTDGNLRNSHIYLRSAARLLPAGAIGGANKEAAANKIRVRFDPGTELETDIAGDKMILRARGPVRDFFERSGAKSGDHVRLRRLTSDTFEIALRRR